MNGFIIVAIVAIGNASLDATTFDATVAAAVAISVGIINVGVVCVMKFCEEHCRCCVSFILRCSHHSISVASGIAVIIYWSTT